MPSLDDSTPTVRPFPGSLFTAGALLLLALLAQGCSKPMTFNYRVPLSRIDLPAKSGPDAPEKLPLSVALVADRKLLTTSGFVRDKNTFNYRTGRYIPHLVKVFLDRQFQEATIVSESSGQGDQDIDLFVKVSVDSFKSTTIAGTLGGWKCEADASLTFLFQDGRGRPLLTKTVHKELEQKTSGIEDMDRYTRLFAEFFGQVFDELAVAIQESDDIQQLVAQKLRQG